MKTKLTKKEQEVMPKVVREWVDNFNRLEFDEQKAKEFVDFLYELSKNDKPLKVILDSPLALQFACNMNKESQVSSQVESQVWSQVWSQVKSQVESQVWSQVSSQVESQVWSQVSSQVESQVWSQVWSQVSSQVKSQVSSQVKSQDLNYYYESTYGRCDDSYWVSFFDYFERIGVKLENKLFQKYKEYMKSGLYSFIAQEGIAYISKPPVFLKRDARHRMHNTSDYAIYFADGFGLHYVDGTYFEPELFQKIFIDKNITFQEIMNLRNSEQKAVAIKYSGIYIQFPKENIIDTLKTNWNDTQNSIEYELYDIQIESINCRFVKVQWYEKGELRTTFIGVPVEDDTNSCLGAVAWTFGMKKEDYILQQEA